LVVTLGAIKRAGVKKIVPSFSQKLKTNGEKLASYK
jgi:hypothetical protein